MNFLLNNDQDLLKVAIQEFARKEIEPCAEYVDHAGVLPEGLLKKIVDLNLPGMVR